MLTILKNCRRTCGMFALLSLVTLSTAVPARSADKSAPARTPKLRQVADVPEDYLGQTFTYDVRISTNQRWMQRSGPGFFLFVEDGEGNKLPNRGFTPDATINLIRFVISKEDGHKLIERLNAGQMYNARIRFTIDRERELIGRGWLYLARVSLIEVQNVVQ